MKVLIESYNIAMQNISGGIQIRIKNYTENYRKVSPDIKLFDKWNDKITDYDILHIFKVNTEDYQLMKFAKNNNIPVVISSVVPTEKQLNILLNRLICKMLPIHTGYWLLNQMLLEADMVIAQTQKEADFINKNYKVPKERINIIPNGVNINIIDEAYKNEFSKRTGITGKYILQVGRFDENKNQLNVIKAMAKSNIPVVFIGGVDSGHPEYYAKCKTFATPNIHFLGWVNHDAPLLSSAYQNAHVVILPSYNEIFGNSLIEGGAAGANLVATNVLPIDDWGLTDYCEKIDPKDINNIRQALIRAYEMPKKPDLPMLIESKFSWDNVIKQHLKLYKYLIDLKV